MNEIGEERNKLIEKYSSYDFPYIVVTAEVDVTKLYEFAKSKNLSFYMATIYAVMHTADGIKNFHYRMDDHGKLTYYEQLTASFTYLPKGWEQFYVVDLPFAGEMIDFCTKAKETADELSQRNDLEIMHGADTPAVIYMSVLPWINYTQFVRTIKDAGKDCIPRISWGKYSKTDDGKISMPVSVQVHHALMDGYHVGMFYEHLQNFIDELKI